MAASQERSQDDWSWREVEWSKRTEGGWERVSDRRADHRRTQSRGPAGNLRGTAGALKERAGHWRQRELPEVRQRDEVAIHGSSKKKKILRGTVRREQKRTVHGRPVRKRWPQTRDRVWTWTSKSSSAQMTTGRSINTIIWAAEWQKWNCHRLASCGRRFQSINSFKYKYISISLNNKEEDTTEALINSSRFTESIQLTKLCNQGVSGFSEGLQTPLQWEQGSAWEHPNPRALENSPAVRSPGAGWEANVSNDNKHVGQGNPVFADSSGWACLPLHKELIHIILIYIRCGPKLHNIKDLLPWYFLI